MPDHRLAVASPALSALLHLLLGGGGTRRVFSGQVILVADALKLVGDVLAFGGTLLVTHLAGGQDGLGLLLADAESLRPREGRSRRPLVGLLASSEQSHRR